VAASFDGYTHGGWLLEEVEKEEVNRTVAGRRSLNAKPKNARSLMHAKLDSFIQINWVDWSSLFLPSPFFAAHRPCISPLRLLHITQTSSQVGD
jgi:hypothetical protein